MRENIKIAYTKIKSRQNNHKTHPNKSTFFQNNKYYHNSQVCHADFRNIRSANQLYRSNILIDKFRCRKRKKDLRLSIKE